MSSVDRSALKATLTAVDLAAFIADPRGRLGCGELAGHPPMDLGNGHTVVDLELAVRVMLRDADRYASMRPEQRRHPITAAKRRLLADNLRRSRERLPCPFLGKRTDISDIPAREGWVEGSHWRLSSARERDG
jgi:hypothetical protein